MANDYYDRPPRRCPDITDIDQLKPGCLVFYRKPGTRMHHVAIHAVTVPNMRLRDRTMEVGPVAFESGGAVAAPTRRVRRCATRLVSG